MDIANQREIYKLVEKLTNRKYQSEVDFLKSLIQEVVGYSQFQITGGRIWQYESDHHKYHLKFQYGNLEKIDDDYFFPVEEYPTLEDLHEVRTKLAREENEELVNKGILIYSVTGVGEIVKTQKGKYFKYLLGFNAPQILQSFYETLTIISSVATVTLRSLVTEEEQKKIKRDIDKASEIQRNLLPEHYLEFHDYKIFGVCIPDNAVGGDYFDYLRNMNDEEDRLGILISDAASKGLPAAIQALFVSGAVRMAQEFSPKISTMFSRLNSLIYDTFPYERFVTLFYCELSLTKNRLVLYANAGHCSPIHYRVDKDEVEMLETTGGLLGIVQKQKFQVENTIMRPGDILALFTDGITEAQDKDGNFYGEQRVIDLIKKYKDEEPKNLVYKIIEDVQIFASNSNYTDDRTLIIIKRDKQ